MKNYLTVLKDIIERNQQDGNHLHVKEMPSVSFDISGFKFPMLSNVGIEFKEVAHKLIWALKGTREIDYLVQNNIHCCDDQIIPGTHIYATLTVAERLKEIGLTHPQQGKELIDNFNAYRDTLYTDEQKEGYVKINHSGKWRPENINELMHTWLDNVGVPRNKLMGGYVSESIGERLRKNTLDTEQKHITLSQALRYLSASGTENEFKETLNYDELDVNFNYDLWVVANMNTRLDDLNSPAAYQLCKWLEQHGYSTTETVACEYIDNLQMDIDEIKAAVDNNENYTSMDLWLAENMESISIRFTTTPLSIGEMVDNLFRSSLLRKADIELHNAEGADVSKEAYCEMDENKLLEWIKENKLPTYGLSCHIQHEDVDAVTRLPHDIMFYGLLTKLMARATNTVPVCLHWESQRCFIQLEHIEQARELVANPHYADSNTALLIKPFDDIDQVRVSDLELITMETN